MNYRRQNQGVLCVSLLLLISSSLLITIAIASPSSSLSSSALPPQAISSRSLPSSSSSSGPILPPSSPSSSSVALLHQSPSLPIHPSSNLATSEHQIVSHDFIPMQSSPHVPGLKGMIKKRLRPGLGNLGRGLVRAAIQSKVPVKKALRSLSKSSVLKTAASAVSSAVSARLSSLSPKSKTDKASRKEDKGTKNTKATEGKKKGSTFIKGAVKDVMKKEFPLSEKESSPSSLLDLKKESRQNAALVAGAIAYGLAALPIMSLPLLFVGPAAYNKYLAKKQVEQEVEKEIDNTLNQLLNVASTLIGSALNSSSSSGTFKFAQALGLSPSSLTDEPNKPVSSLAAQLSGDAVFTPGLFNPHANTIMQNSGKYKPYIYKQGPITTTTRRPSRLPGSDDDLDLDAERKSGDGDKETQISAEEAASLASLTSKDNLASIAMDVFKTVSDGIRRFELDKTECKERLVCEVSQKYAGSSFKSWATALMHVLDIDTRVERSKVGKNAVLRTIYRGARSSLNPDKTCADLFPGCSAL